MKTVFLTHLFSTLIMTGVIWFAQAVHYPLLRRVGEEAFVAYEKENTRRTGWVVIPVMAVELITALLLLWRQPEGLLPIYVWLNGALLALIWVSTLMLQGPDHQLLMKKFDPAVWRFFWTGRGALLLFLIGDIWSKGTA